jgi:hypothetical protein
MPKQCRHIMTTGIKCHAIALRDKPYCHYHMKLHRLMGAARSPSESQDRDFEFTFPDSPASLQLAVFQIISALGSSQITLKRAGMILYALQIATQNVDRSSTGVPSYQVHCVTQLENGDEVGPECESESPDDCGKCVQFEHCPVVAERARARSAAQSGKPIRTLPEVLQDAIWQNLSGFSRERFEKVRDMTPESEFKLPLLKT